MKIKQGNRKTKEPPKAERDKEEQLFYIQIEFKNNKVELKEYFNKLTYHVTYPYGEIDEDNENKDDCDQGRHYENQRQRFSATIFFQKYFLIRRF